MTITYTTTEEAAVANGVKMLVYGGAGLGKTMLCATLPTPIILSAESGLLSLSKQNITRVFGKDTPGINYSMPVMEITTIDDLMDAYQWCTESKEAQEFETIALDSITEIGETVLANAKENAKDPRQAYGELIERMILTIKSFRDIPSHHIYFSAKQEMVKDDVSQTTLFGPAMPGSKLGPQLPYLFDEVFNLAIAKTKEGSEYRYLRTQPNLQHSSKDRSGALAEIEEPNLGKIIDKIRASF